jgi:hypothetical protein
LPPHKKAITRIAPLELWRFHNQDQVRRQRRDPQRPLHVDSKSSLKRLKWRKHRSFADGLMGRDRRL